jgi:predicted phosphoribosyltransferase
MRFKNRYDAAMQLIPLLEKYKGKNGIVLAIPRGGVPIGYYIAKALGFYLDLALTKKIGHPLNKELAIGAVSLEDIVIDEEFKVSPSYIDQETDRIREGLREKYEQLMGDRQPADLKGKVVIIVDDGAATGATILASLEMVRRSHPVKLIVAVPVSSKEAAVRIREQADEFICPLIPENLVAVGLYYEDFSEVDDEDVIELLKETS